MDLKEKIKSNIEELEPHLLQDVLDYINSLKQQKNKKEYYPKTSHKEVQKMLSSSHGTWADDVSSEREEKTIIRRRKLIKHQITIHRDLPFRIPLL